MAKIVGSRGPVDMDLKSMGGSFKAIKAQCDRQGSEPAKRGPKSGKSALSSSSAKNPMGYKRGGAVASGAPKTKDDGIQQLRCGGKAEMKNGRQKAEVGGVMGNDPTSWKKTLPGNNKQTATYGGANAIRGLARRADMQGDRIAALNQAAKKAALVAGRDDRRAAKIAEKQQTGGPGQMGPGDNTNRRTPQEPVTPITPGRGGKMGVAPLPGGRLRGPGRPGISPRIAPPSPGGITPLPQGETIQGGDTLDRTMQKRGGKVKPHRKGR